MNYICDAIDSAINQTYPNVEIIVVNDGSTDNTEEICLSYGDRIRYFSKANGGVATALNHGIRKMRGEYFTWLAHDDMFYPNKLEMQIKTIEQFADKSLIIHGNYDLLSVKYDAVSHIKQEDNYSIEQLENSVFPLLMGTMHASTPLIHISHFERVGLFDESLPLTQDYDLLFRMMRGEKTLFLQEPLLISRLHEHSGKNIDNRFGKACVEQYERFIDLMSYSEVSEMFDSPRAFYCRIAAMMKARFDTYNTGFINTRIAELLDEGVNTVLVDYISAYHCKKICIFGVGFHGKVLQFELSSRGIDIDYFCDNDSEKYGLIINDKVCIPLIELEKYMNDTLIIIAADVSDAIKVQLSALGFPHVITKKSIDNLILTCPPTC